MSKKKTLDQFINEAQEVHKDEEGVPLFKYHLIEEYVNTDTPVPIFCPIEGHGVSWQRPANHLRGKMCIKCSYILRSRMFALTLEEFILKARLVHGDKYDYSKVIYVNAKTKVIIICPVHGEFEQTPNSHLAGQRCPRCKESKGEEKIANQLDNLKIPYVREYKIDGYRYRYDFYLEGYNLLIEFHGEQHYESKKHFGGKKALSKRQKRDKAKVELAKRNGIELLVISYLEIDQIEEILKYELHTKVKNSKIVDISHVYALYCNIDTNKNNLRRYHNILYSYLKDEDMSNTMSKYHLLNNKHDEINRLLKDSMDIFKSIFIRLLVIENKMLVETVKAYKDGKILK